MLGTEYAAFEACMQQPHFRGIRVNTLKFDVNHCERLGLPIRKCPFSDSGFYLDSDEMSIGNSPWHHAGAFYSQEPSAMSAVTVLNPQPGERVLDMCAAPGGKSTQIAALLNGEGLLWSNEYVRKRAQILLSNVERMGIRNCVVSSTHPDRLAEGLRGFFDRVLVDAPCSGEGMFRRDPQADEDVIASFLDSHPEFCLEPCGVEFGRPGYDRSDKYDLTLTRRIFPMDGGEGHFAARLRKTGECFDAPVQTAAARQIDDEKRAAALFAECFHVAPYGRICRIGESCYLLPELMPDVKGLGVLRGGVLLGDIMKNRIEPSHALFMAAHAEECKGIVSLSHDSPALAAFLHGEEISVDGSLKGYVAVACEGTVTGFGKCSGGRLKNRYPKGLRTL